MMTEGTNFRNYDIRTDPIPVHDFKSPEAEALISREQPVVLQNCDLISTAFHWDLEYLEKHIGSAKFIVYESLSHVFKYHEESKVQNCADFQPSIIRKDMKFPTFAQKIRDWKPGQKRLYLQQILNDKVGSNIVKEFLGFNWGYVHHLQKKNKWGELSSNLLLIALEGNVTPCHYDEQHNIFCQIRGKKKFILFSPSQFECFYPHPVHHPHDRQSQIDFESPDYIKFPKFQNAHGYETILGPGDVLYLPLYWWHYVESEDCSGPTLSINFWFKPSAMETITYPLKDEQKIAIMRNIEKMLFEALRDPNEVKVLLRNLAMGRYL